MASWSQVLKNVVQKDWQEIGYLALASQKSLLALFFLNKPNNKTF